MTTAGRNAPLSPISVGGSEWSVSKYASRDDFGRSPNTRGNLASPPNSGGSIGNMSMNGFPSGPRSNAGGPSPPASIGRSSTGTNLFSPGSDGRGNGRFEMDESMLNEHYMALKAFLNARDSSARQQPNKARDKLLRLSAVQFYELSTDVFDELMRRQAIARTPPNAPNGPAAFLLPEKTFHPKRNQARQRLSSLGPPRFRDLAADVYNELERRFPHFVGRDIPRGGSSMSMRGGPISRTGTPANGAGPFPPRGQSRIRKPSDASSMRGTGPYDAYGMPPSPSLPGGEQGRPMQKQVNQNNTIVPNKSTMLEEDDEGGATSEADKKLIDDYQRQITDMQDKLTNMEEALKTKDEQLSSALDGERSRATASNLEKKEWSDVRLDLENKVAEAESLNKSMKMELDRLRADHEQETRQLRKDSSARSDSQLQQENDQLRRSLQEQEQVTEEVRREAQEFLQEMRTLSKQSETTYEKQLELEKTNDQLEREVREWRNRYARSKAQMGGMRASSIGLPLGHDPAKLVREKGFIEENGVVKDVHVTKFQIAIDELVQTARRKSPERVVDVMKLVVVSVRRITRDLDESAGQDDDFAHQQSKLKARVSATANGLITASKNFAAGAGISPVSLLDAAASNLTAAVVELLRAVKIRPTPAGELEDDDDGTVTPVDSAGGFFSPRSTTQASSTQGSLPPPPPFQGLGGAGARASTESSAYSPINSPRESMDPYPSNGLNGMTNGSYLGMGKGPNGYHDSRGSDVKMQNPYSAYEGI